MGCFACRWGYGFYSCWKRCLPRYRWYAPGAPGGMGGVATPRGGGPSAARCNVATESYYAAACWSHQLLSICTATLLLLLLPGAGSILAGWNTRATTT